MPQELKINLNKTAIVAVDLQKGIATPQVVPNSAKDVVENTTKLLDVFRKNNMPVFLVHATPSPD
ncbi:MAG: isochorismatase family protein, partial [Ignavibacteriaceae bacterium]|nr:isochorismatase family protein [Ignavibacteriaceae bacterium]